MSRVDATASDFDGDGGSSSPAARGAPDRADDPKARDRSWSVPVLRDRMGSWPMDARTLLDTRPATQPAVFDARGASKASSARRLRRAMGFGLCMSKPPPMVEGSPISPP